MSRRRKNRDRRAHHAADQKRSARLQRLLGVLKSCPGASSITLIRKANIVSLSNAIGELRLNGNRIECERRNGIWYWNLRRHA